MQTYTYEEACKVLGSKMPTYLKPGTMVRIIKINGMDVGCPCGGTHVKHVNEIGGMKIEKIKACGSKAFRISYQIVDSI